MSTAAQPFDFAAIVRRMDEQFVRNAQAGDVDALVDAFYAPDAQVFPPGHPLASGSDEIRQVWRGVIASGLTGITLDTRKVESSGELAYSTGRYILTMTPPGQSSVTTAGKYVVVYRKQPTGEWRAVADIFNSD